MTVNENPCAATTLSDTNTCVHSQCLLVLVGNLVKAVYLSTYTRIKHSRESH